jgi:hypothetical protein
MADSYWEAIKRGLKSVFTGVVSGYAGLPSNVAGGLAVGTTAQKFPTTPAAPQAIAQITQQRQEAVTKAAEPYVSKAVETAAGPAEFFKVSTAVDKTLQAANEFYEFAYPKISRPVTTALLLKADEISGQGLDFIKNWNLSKEVSPGQAAANLVSKGYRTIGLSPLAEKTGVSIPPFLDPNFNIADPDQRKKAFQDDIFGKLWTGTMDGLANWYADPLVIVGKGAKVARIAGLERPVQTAEDVARVRSELDSHGMWLKTGGQVGRETPMGVAVQDLVGKTGAQAYDSKLVRNSNNPTFMAGVAGDIDNYDDMAHFFAAAYGDNNSLLRLAQSRASIADEITRMKDILDPIEKRLNDIPWGQGTDMEKITPTIEEWNRLNEVLTDLQRRDTALARAMSENVGDYRLITDYSSAADVQLFGKNIGVAIEKARAAASDAYHNFTFYTETFQKTPFSRPVAVIQAAFNKLPRGLVKVDGLGTADSFNEIKYALNSVKSLRNPDYIPLKNDLAQQYLTARNATERAAAVNRIEEEAKDLIAAEMGFTAEEANRIYSQFASVRNVITSSFKQKGFWVDDNGKLITSPFWKSELPNVVPMMDFKDFEKALRMYKLFGEKGGKLVVAGRETSDYIDFLNSFWKASVLTRMGYPIRNAIDGSLRASLVLGSMSKTENTLRTFGKNIKTRAKISTNFVGDTIALRNPAQLRTYTGKLVASRNNFIEVRNQILDELAPKEYYANASGTFGKRIDPEDVDFAIRFSAFDLLNDNQRKNFLQLKKLKSEQNGLLFGKDLEKYKELEEKAFGRYVRSQIVPNLPKGTTLVYADYPSGKVFYKIPGAKGRIPKGAIPTPETRKGLPPSMLEMEVAPGKKFKARAKEPSARPDIRVVTSYEVSRAKNYEDIADIIGEEQMRRIRLYTDAINSFDKQINDKILQAQELAAIRNELKIVKSGEGVDTYITPKGQSVEVSGAFSGPAGLIVRKEASGDQSLNWLTENQSYLSFDAAKGSTSALFEGKLGTRIAAVAPTDPQYFNELAKFTNNILRNDQLAMRILKGESDYDISKWLRSKEGDFYLREIDADIKTSDILPHIQEARSRIYKLFPDTQMRSLVARDTLTPEQFDMLMRGNPNLISVPGREIMENTLGYGSGTVKRLISKNISSLFKVIGTTPENNLVAWPFYEKLYKKNLQREINLAEGLGKNLQDENVIINLQRTAHANTKKVVNETLYRITNNSGISNTLRFVIPFFNAQYNAVKVYGRLLAQDPSRLARASQIWNMPNRIATVVDNEGNQVPPGAGPSTDQYILFTIPEGMQGKFGIPKGYQISIPKNSLNVFLQGQNPLLPSFGIPVTMSVSQFAKSRPENIESARGWLERNFGKEFADGVMSSILPFGQPAANPWDLLLPAAGQKIKAQQQGLDNIAKANAVVSAMKTQYYEWVQNGRVGSQPTFGDAERLANQLYDIRIAANLVLPFTFTFRPEWQVIVEDYRKAIDDPNIGLDKVNDYILNKYGDLGYILTASSNMNKTGVSPTISAVRNQKEFEPLIKDLDRIGGGVPGLVGFVVNYGINADKYSVAAANYFRDKEVRIGGNYKYTERRDPEEVLKDREISLGWTYYTKLAAGRDAKIAELQKMGYKVASINSPVMKQLGYDKDWENALTNLERLYPAWAEERRLGIQDINKTNRYIAGLTRIVQDEKFMKKNGNTPTMKAISDYIVNRTYLVQELQRREAQGGSKSLANKSNQDLKDTWENYVLQLSVYDGGFSELYNRYLDNDKFEVIKNG